MVSLRDIRRILLLVVGAGAAIWVSGILLEVNQNVYVQSGMSDIFLQLQPAQSAEPLTFPFRISGTSLVAEALVSYDGPFLEDGTGREVFNCVALLMRNASPQGIQQAQISVHGMDRWTFNVQNIPPNARILVLESSAAQLTDHCVLVCSGWETKEDERLSMDTCLRFDSVDMGSVAVTNITASALTGVRLRYKNWLPGSDIYVGGNTYEIGIDRIAPGQTVYLEPEHYVSGYSKFVMYYVQK